MALIGITVLLIILTPLIIVFALLAAALWTLGQLVFERS